MSTNLISTWALKASMIYSIVTSRKHGKKEPQLFFYCSSFDHHALQLLNNCIFVFLDLATDTVDILELVIYRWKGLENTFPTVYHTPQHIYFFDRKMKNKLL